MRRIRTQIIPWLLGVAILLRRERRAIRTMIAGWNRGRRVPWAASQFLAGPSGAAKGSAWTGTPATLSWSLPSLAVRILDPSRNDYLTPSKWMLGTNLEHFHLAPPLAAAELAVSILALASGLFALVRWPVCASGKSRRRGCWPRSSRSPSSLRRYAGRIIRCSNIRWSRCFSSTRHDGANGHAWPPHSRSRAGLPAAHVLDEHALAPAGRCPRRHFPLVAVPPVASIGLFAMSVSRAARATLAHERPRHWLNLPDYSRLPAATRLAPLHDGRLSPSLGRSGR